MLISTTGSAFGPKEVGEIPLPPGPWQILLVGAERNPIAGSAGLQRSTCWAVSTNCHRSSSLQTHGTIVGAPLATGTEWFEIGEEQDGEGEQQRGSLKLCEHMRARMDAMHSIIMGRQQFETTMTAAISTMRHDIGGFHEALKNHGSRMEEVSNTLQLMHK